MALPLQFGIPGGPELLVLLLVAVLMFGVPLLLVVVGLAVYHNRSGAGDRVAELEDRIDDLERELDAERSGTTADAGAGPDGAPGDPEDAESRDENRREERRPPGTTVRFSRGGESTEA